jgi:hypothetical protein
LYFFRARRANLGALLKALNLALILKHIAIEVPLLVTAKVAGKRARSLARRGGENAIFLTCD